MALDYLTTPATTTDPNQPVPTPVPTPTKPATTASPTSSWQSVLENIQNFITGGNLAPTVNLQSQRNLAVEMENQDRIYKAYQDAVAKAQKATNAKGSDNVDPAAIKKQMQSAASSEGKQYGGWYDNPATGKNERYWGNGIWTSGSEPSFGTDVNDIAKLAPTAPAVPAFEWDRNQAEQDALTKLTPYYDELLAQANGDVELAKQRLLEDYQTGTRQDQEDFTTIVERSNQDYLVGQRTREQDFATKTERTSRDVATQRQQAVEDYLTQSQEYARLEPEEKAKVLEGLNQRGMLQSTIAKGETTNLTERQQARREAITRALERKDQLNKVTQANQTQDMLTSMQRAGEAAQTTQARTQENAASALAKAEQAAGTTLNRGTQDLDIALPRYVDKLEQEKAQRALEMADMARTTKYTDWLAEQTQNLNSYTG